MNKKKLKRIPFDINVAMRIKSGQLNGSFVKRDGKTISWLSDNVLTPDTYNELHGNQLFADVRCGYVSYFQTDKYGRFNPKGREHFNDVYLLLEDSEERTFVPARYQSCIVRNTTEDQWRIAVHTGNLPFTGSNAFYDNINEESNSFTQKSYTFCLPLNEKTIKLVGTKNNYTNEED